MSTHRSIAKSAGVIAALTAVSRVLGFIRDVVIAQAFGTTLAAEAFVVSFKIPNLLRDLVGEGAMNAAFVPVLTECREKRSGEFWRLVSTLFIVMTIVLISLSLAGIFFAPKIVALIAPGFTHSVEPGKFPLAVRLTRVISPYIFLIGLSALVMGVLNSLGEFTSSAVGPIFLNLSMILAGVFFEQRYGPMALVIGVLLGGVLQLLCQVPLLLKKGFRFYRPNFKDSSVLKIGKLLLPRALGSGLYQINVFVDSILASFEKIVGLGGQSALYYSNRLFQLPLAIFGVALAQALLPAFSLQIVRDDIKGFKETFSAALRTLLWMTMPAAVGLIVLSEPIIRILFERGRFDTYSTQITSGTLFFYGFGLAACCFIKILANAFYAMHDTRTPVKSMASAVALNIILSLIFMRTFKIAGLALASSISATVNAGQLYYLLRRRIGGLHSRRLVKSFVKIFFISVAMGAVAVAANYFWVAPAIHEPLFNQMLRLIFTIGLSVSVYLGLSFVLRVEEAKKFFPR